MLPDMKVNQVWRQIEACQGEPFHLVRGAEFRYEIHGNQVVPDRVDYPIHRGQFEKALERVPLTSTNVVHDLRAPSYIYAILMDPRIRAAWDVKVK
jgi:hypothetical protein